MKRMKKLLAVMLAAIMVMGMTTSVFAASATITITGVATDNHTFSAYQIFDGDVSGTTMSNVTWGTGIDSGKLLAAIVAAASDTSDTLYAYFNGEGITTSSSAAEVAAVITQYIDDSTFIKAFAALLKNCLGTLTGSTDSGSPVSDGYTYQITGLDDGYYLVLDSYTNSSSDSGEVLSSYILQVLTGSPNEISTKASVPSVTKTVTDTDGNEAIATSASAEDTVYFTLTASMPRTYADYSIYSLVFHDTLTSNLTFNSTSVVVTVNTYIECTGLTAFATDTTYYTEASGVYTAVTDTSSGPVNGTTYYTLTTTEVASTDGGYTLITPSSTDTCSFHVSIEDTNSLKDENDVAITVNSSSTIVVTYSATVSSGIEAGTEETNSVTLEYSNDPTDTSTTKNSDGTTTTTETGTTTPVKVKVYTFDLELKKTYSGDAPQSSDQAQFTLYKKVTETLSASDFGTGTTYYTISGNTVTEATSYNSTAIYYTLVTTKTVSSSDPYTATFNDLGEGDYVLIESHTPTGYNTADAITFTIEATYNESGEVTSLSSSTGVTASTTSKVTTTVANYSGTALPVTGGIGTTIFYVVGTILVLGAALVLVNRRRVVR